MTLSVSIVCKNNEATIGRTLGSVSGLVAGLGGEIVAVDSGSTDGTIGLLARHGARVVRSPWLGFVGTKQLGLGACTGEWVLCLDSDESLDSELCESVQAAVGRGGGPDGYFVHRKVYYRGRALNYAWQPERRLRLVRRERAVWAGGECHEALEVRPAAGGAAGVGTLRGMLRHDSIPTFSEFMGKQAVYGRLMAETMRREGRRGSVLSLIVSPPGAFLKQIVLKQAFRDGVPGWLAAAATAAATLMKHAALLELTRVGPDDPEP